MFISNILPHIKETFLCIESGLIETNTDNCLKCREQMIEECSVHNETSVHIPLPQGSGNRMEETRTDYVK